MLRFCPQCGEEKLEDAFAPSRRECHLCKAAYDRAYYLANKAHILEIKRHYKTTHKDIVAAHSQAYRARHPDRIRQLRQKRKPRKGTTSKSLQATRQWRTANKDRVAAYNQAYKATHKDQIAITYQTYRHKHMERILANNAKRRACQRGASIGERINRSYIYARDGGICHICGRKAPKDAFTLDHLIPLSLGGPHTRKNIRVAHHLCNSRRGAGRTPAQLLLVG